MANLANKLFAQESARPDHIAVRFADRQLSFDRLASDTRRIAGGLASVGIGPGSRVGLMMSASPEFICFQHAVFALGAIFSPLNIFYRASEVLHAVESCELEYLIVGPQFLERMPRADAPGLESLRALILATGQGTLPGYDLVCAENVSARAQPLRAPIQLPDSAVGMMLHTSATTGKSKGVMLSIANVTANYDRTPGWLGLAPQTVILCALPLYNTFGLNQCINALMVTGGTLVLLPRFDAQVCLESIERYRCSFLPAVPTMLSKLLDHPAAARHDLASLELIMTGGAPVPAALLERLRAVFGPRTRVLTGYGLTEATALVTLERIELDAARRDPRPHSIGRVQEGMELGILADDGTPVEADIVGEICVRGPNVMSGYYKRPDDSALALAGGWLHTGDLGYIDAHGCAYIVDRKKDVIIRGGQNLYPAEIEEAIYRLAAVREVAVVRRPDALLGEVPVAFIAADPLAQLTADEVIAHCKAELAYFKVPAAVEFRTELPKGPTGKILRRDLASPHSA